MIFIWPEETETIIYNKLKVLKVLASIIIELFSYIIYSYLAQS